MSWRRTSKPYGPMAAELDQQLSTRPEGHCGRKGQQLRQLHRSARSPQKIEGDPQPDADGTQEREIIEHSTEDFRLIRGGFLARIGPRARQIVR